MQTFCTLFDSKYLSRGLAMYESLATHCSAFELFVFPFDAECAATLRRLALPRVHVVQMEDFEDQALRAAKGNRDHIEYLWTCTPSTVLYVLERLGRGLCTYLDADVYFFGRPDPLIDELGGDSVLITEHRYTPRYDRTTTSGRYNVQFMTFRHDNPGLRVARWWRAACLESCELNPAEGKCGDQKYLDDWLERFPGVHVLQHLGGGVAPWNVQQYELSASGESVRVRESSSGRESDLVFFHFHGLRISTQGRVMLTGLDYELAQPVVELLYRPYLRHLDEIKRRLRRAGVPFDPHGSVPDSSSWLRVRLGMFKRRALMALRSGQFARLNYNVPYDLEDFTQ